MDIRSRSNCINSNPPTLRSRSIQAANSKIDIVTQSQITQPDSLLGPACSSAATSGAPILWKAGITDIATATTAPKLTAPDRKPEYDGFMRTVYSDIDQGASDAKYVHDVLKAQKIVTIHDGSPYAQQLATVMGDNFKKLGGTVLSQEAVAPTDVDMHPVLTRIATEKPDVIYAPVFVAPSSKIVGAGHFDRRAQTAQTNRLIAKLRSLGYAVQIIPVAA